MDEVDSIPEIVKISYKTGDYVGEACERDDRRVLVKVLAVLQHPTQGDLHSSYDPDAAIFHERRALAYTEKVWVPIQTAHRYTGAIPEYRQSLNTALGIEMEKIDRLKRWSELSLEKLETLRKDYGL
ncbi:sporulation phosphorelay system protein KapB [Cohnella lupini]|uniref:Kinase-associated protein B n=1 Tax=Cohnella lupini TaxID=1294267 RepID=A0A3D9ITF9_9BACL|nr:sporulation phosphorelay system protein KapB [Cohnella lupini]RED65034.1 kinase-associated protein B [Cohnella lupini]